VSINIKESISYGVTLLRELCPDLSGTTGGRGLELLQVFYLDDG